MDKSDPAIFAKATELLGVTPQECIFFDDSVKSCRSAKASGMTVIGVYDPFSRARRTKCRSFATASSATLVKCCKA